MKDAEAIYDITGDRLKLVTLAPEMSGIEPFIDFFRKRNIRISAGHTAATYDEFNHAIQRGVNRTTHSFNAMGGIHHRKPGVMEAAILNDRVYCEVIADGLHVHPEIVKWLITQKGKNRWVAISDASAAAGLPDGTYKMAGKTLVKEGRSVKLEGQNTLSGSAITLLDALHFLHKELQLDLGFVLHGLSMNPCDSLGIPNKGRFKNGYDADYVLLNHDLNVRSTYLEGELVYKKEVK